ncbi:MAG: hypothetical protein Q4F95_14510 [Oscillospiraceae bacterium]|nr:hypothetical protein [Oscillospiraceae bacterium]
MNNIKISMLGVSGSGKTAFLSGICDTFISDNIQVGDKNDENIMHLYRILPYNADDLSRTNVGDIRRFSIRSNRSFTSVSTEDTSRYMLSLYDDCVSTHEQLCTISFIDYKGGFIEELVNEHSDEAVADVRDEILSSNVILIFADAIKLSLNDNPGQYNSMFGNEDINTFFNTNTFTNSSVTVLFILTKDDNVHVSDDDELLTERLRKAFEPAIKIMEHNKWNIGIIRTSAIGVNSADPESNRLCEDAMIRPYGIDSVIFYSIYRCFGEEVTALCIKIDELEKLPLIARISKETKNKLKILRSQLDETRCIYESIRTAYNNLYITDSLIWEHSSKTTGVNVVSQTR